MFKKLFLSFFVFLNLIYTTYAIDFGTILKPFEDLYLALEKGNILDGIVVIVFFTGLFLIFRNIFSKVFKGSGNQPAARGASLILSIMITGAMVMNLGAKESFTQYYGNIILLVVSLLFAVGGFGVYFRKIVGSDFPGLLKLIYIFLGLVVTSWIISAVSFKAHSLTSISFFKNLHFWSLETLGLVLVLLSIAGFVYLFTRNKAKSQENSFTNPHLHDFDGATTSQRVDEVVDVNVKDIKNLVGRIQSNLTKLANNLRGL